ncbi:MAG: permease [Hyphomicrobiaceae bacterium]|nr:permease [Hyphomicrobiaceae bacterium]MCC0024013.1 permease [Hyphomicrobiaceae bacterium]
MALQDLSQKPNFLERMAGIDRVLITIAALFIALALFDRTAVGPVATSTLDSLVHVAPFLLLSIAIAAYASASGADNLIARVFSGNPVIMIFAAAAFGALSPFCSCGVIPIIAALLSMGVPVAPVMAFWLASPIMDPSMFVMTLGVLGWQFAIGKTIAAFGIGVLGGFGLMGLMRLPQFAEPLKDDVGNGGCGGSAVRAPKQVVWRFWSEGDRVTRFMKSARKNGWFLLRWMVLAFVLEAIMIRYVPADLVGNLVGGDGLMPIVIAAFVGVPAYLNGFAALPLVSGLLDQGMSPGAAISFMVAGGVTCIPAAIAVYALVKKQVFAAYLVFALGGSLLAGLIFQLLTG